MKMLLMKMLSVESKESTAESLSKELVPSQSRRYMSTGSNSSPMDTWMSTGLDQIQMPLVQALVVPPTGNPFIFLTSWLAKNDLPDL